MKRLIGAVAILVAVLLWHTEAAASCTTITTILPDGSVQICQLCCYGSSCTQTCF